MLDAANLPTHLFDLGHQGDVDWTLLELMLRKSPHERLCHHERWRAWITKKGVSMNPFMEEVIRRLVEEQCEFVVVGGVGAILLGASVMTLDLDLCYRRTPDNITKLVRAIGPLNPRPRGFPEGLPYILDERIIQLGCNFTLQINEEALDLLGEMSAIGGYDDIIGRAVEVTLGTSPVKVLSLEDLIATKTATNRPKDLIVLPVLRELLELRREKSSG